MRGGCGGDRTGRSGNSNVQDEKCKATGADKVRLEMMEMAGEVGVKWTGRLQNEPSTETAGEGFICKDQEKSRK